jgi:hypothetical protein
MWLDRAINARDKNFTEAKMKRRLVPIDESIAPYIAHLETADHRRDRGRGSIKPTLAMVGFW